MPLASESDHAAIRVLAYGLELVVEVYPDGRGVLVLLSLGGRVVGGAESVRARN